MPQLSHLFKFGNPANVDLKLFYAIFYILKLFYAMTSIVTSMLLTKWPADLEHLVLYVISCVHCSLENFTGHDS